MKLFVKLFLVVFLSNTLSAQDSLKFSPNSWTTEVNINFFDGEISLNNSLNQFKVRKFKNNGLAYRVAIGVRDINQNSKTKEEYGYSPIDYELKMNSFEFNLSFGIEKHFKGTKRLSPYLGWELSASYKSSSQTTSQNGAETKIKGCWLSYEYYDYSSGYYIRTIYSERGYTAFGINIVSGMDYYVSKNLYVGFEFMFGFNYKVYQKISIDTPDVNSDEADLESAEFNFGPNIINGFRIGYVF